MKTGPSLRLTLFAVALFSLIAAFGARPNLAGDEPAPDSPEEATAAPPSLATETPAQPEGEDPHRSPISLALAKDGTWLLTANQTADTVSLVEVGSGKVHQEVKTGSKPAGVALSLDGRLGVVTHWYGYDVAILAIDEGHTSLKVAGRVEVGPEPRGVVIAPDGKTAYVAVGASNELVRIDLDSQRVSGRLSVGREPRGLALSADGNRLVVGNARSKSVCEVSTRDWDVVRTIGIDGDNLRQVALSADGQTAYIANMHNRGFPTTSNSIDLGWVLGQRLTRISLGEGEEGYATLSLDARGKAAGDAHGVAVSQDGRFLAVSCGGTHEVMIFRTDLRRLPWRANSSRDLIAPELLSDDGRFRRVRLGGRPTELAFAPDGKTLFVANYLADALQVVDAESAELVRTIPLGSPASPSLARRGEALFHDAERSFNQWYSCNTCHSDGHTNGLDFDTLNDGRQDLSTAHLRSRKKVPTLRRVSKTGPWTWHGWQTSLEDAAVESFTKSMQGERPSADDLKAVVAFLETLDYPRNPNLPPDGELSGAALRGRDVFRSTKAACNTCHGGPEYTDGKIHEVGLEEPDDAYRGYNPPSLRGLYDKDPYLHDGRARSLREVLEEPHDPELVTGLGRLSDEELSDLIAYLKTL
jgi:YVTN family beta-propeller protein